MNSVVAQAAVRFHKAPFVAGVLVAAGIGMAATSLHADNAPKPSVSVAVSASPSSTPSVPFESSNPTPVPSAPDSPTATPSTAASLPPSGSTSVSPSPVTYEVPTGDPVELRVTTAGQSAPLIDALQLAPTHISSDGNLYPPSLRAVGWDADSGWVKPGYPGTAILVGHVDTKTGANVFTNISKIRPGDKVTVRYSSGACVAFQVTAYKPEPKDSLHSDTAVWTPSDTPLLRLITCDNTTPFKDGHYAGNWSVIANKYLGIVNC